jgi:hypothetical protein
VRSASSDDNIAMPLIEHGRFHFGLLDQSGDELPVGSDREPRYLKKLRVFGATPALRVTRSTS